MTEASMGTDAPNSPPTSPPLRVVIVGAGIAGAAAAAELCRARPDAAVTLVSREPHVKAAINVVRLSKYVESFDVAELDAAAFAPPNLTIVVAAVAGLDLEGRNVLLSAAQGDDGDEEGDRSIPPLPFDAVIVATGAAPRRVADHPSVMVLRDSDSVSRLASTLSTARTVVVAGNGGIALGLAHELGRLSAQGGGGADDGGKRRRRLHRVVWAAKHGHVGDAFFDVDAAAFLARYIGKAGGGPAAGGGEAAADTPRGSVVLRAAGGPAGAPAPLAAHRTSMHPASHLPAAGGGFGAAAGPGWVAALSLAAAGGGGGGDARPPPPTSGETTAPSGLETHLGATVASVADPSPGGMPGAVVTLTDGTVIEGVDAVVSAIGVAPDTAWVPPAVARSPDGGLEVDADMRSVSHPFIYAAGDAATVRPSDRGPHWFPMRLWSQARLTGGVAGAAVAGVPPLDRPGGLGLELFAHATAFAGLPVVLLGCYNGQGLEGGGAAPVITYVREEDADTDGSPFFARVLVHGGRLAGAVLIGPGAVSLAGVLEDLILDGVDVGFLGPRILDPALDLEAIFD